MDREIPSNVYISSSSSWTLIKKYLRVTIQFRMLQSLRMSLQSPIFIATAVLEKYNFHNQLELPLGYQQS